LGEANKLKIRDHMNTETPIEYEDAIEFEYDAFSIFYIVDNNTWYASAYDEDKYESDIIIQDDKIQYEDNLKLFDDFILTREEFDSLNRSIEVIRNREN